MLKFTQGQTAAIDTAYMNLYSWYSQRDHTSADYFRKTYKPTRKDSRTPQEARARVLRNWLDGVNGDREVHELATMPEHNARAVMLGADARHRHAAYPFRGYDEVLTSVRTAVAHYKAAEAMRRDNFQTKPAPV